MQLLAARSESGGAGVAALGALVLWLVTEGCAMAPALSPAVDADLDVREAVLRSFLDRGGDLVGPDRVICVSLGGGSVPAPPDDAFLSRFRDAGYRMVPWTSCSIDENADPPRLRHADSGRAAIGFYLGAPSFADAGHATVRTRYYVDGDNVGDHRCSAVRLESRWRVEDCTLVRG